MAGIEKLKQWLDVVMAGAGAVQNALVDGKLGLEDIGHLVSVLIPIGPALQNVGDLPKEFSDLDESESAALMAHVKSRLPSVVSDEDTRKVVEAGLKVALGLGELWAALKKDEAPAA